MKVLKSQSSPMFMEFSTQEYWSGLPFPPSGDLPDPGIEPVSPALPAGSLLLSHWESSLAQKEALFGNRAVAEVLGQGDVILTQGGPKPM